MKKFLALLLSAVMIAAFAGCGDKPEGSSEESKTSETSATEVQATEETQETLESGIKSQLDQMLTKNKFSGVVQITKGNDVVYQYADGNDDNGKPLTIDSSMPIASTSKQFCAAAVMLLSEQNKLSVDDTLDKFFPDYQYGKKISVKNLLNMGSGIPNYYMDFLDPSALGSDEAENTKKMKEALFAQKLNFEPGQDYEYSNSNYFLLAEIVQQLSGAPYHDFIRKNFFEPLGMTHTGFVEEISQNPDWASALSKTEQLDETSKPGLAKGAGDIVSNAADMDKWMHGLSGGKVVSPESFKQMTTNANEYSSEEYCYGLWHMPFNGVGHVGQIEPHFGSIDYMNPERGFYLFGMSNNGHGMSYVQQLPQAAFDILLGNQQ